MLYRYLADLAALLHLAFILFVVLGGLLVLRWRWLAWIHLPCAIWGALIEIGQWICPLTYVENAFLHRAGMAGYDQGFIAHHLFGLIYPQGLTRGMEVGIAVVVTVINTAVYRKVFHGKKKMNARGTLSALLLLLAIGCRSTYSVGPSATSVINASDAPRAVGPYSQAIRVGNVIYTSGQLPLDPATGNLVEGDFSAQARRVFQNLDAVLQAAGTDFGHVVKANVYLTNLADFQTLNTIYAQYFGDHKPARSTVGVAQLPRGAAVEIELVAVK